MASSITVVLDTAAPGSPIISLQAGAAAATQQDITATITTSDGSTVGYQVKIWGNVDPSGNASIQTTEGASSWISLASPHAVRLSTVDGVKTISARIRDDVFNETSIVSDTITLDTIAPVVTTNAPSPAKISKQATKDTTTFTWSADAVFEEFKIKVVSNAGDLHNTGTLIPTTAGSTGITGTAGGYPASTNRTATIKGTDLEAASPGDGNKIVKVFVRDDAGNWSV